MSLRTLKDIDANRPLWYLKLLQFLKNSFATSTLYSLEFLKMWHLNKLRTYQQDNKVGVPTQACFF